VRKLDRVLAKEHPGSNTDRASFSIPGQVIAVRRAIDRNNQWRYNNLRALSQEKAEAVGAISFQGLIQASPYHLLPTAVVVETGITVSTARQGEGRSGNPARKVGEVTKIQVVGCRIRRLDPAFGAVELAKCRGATKSVFKRWIGYQRGDPGKQS